MQAQPFDWQSCLAKRPWLGWRASARHRTDGKRRSCRRSASAAGGSRGSAEGGESAAPVSLRWAGPDEDAARARRASEACYQIKADGAESGAGGRIAAHRLPGQTSSCPPKLMAKVNAKLASAQFSTSKMTHQYRPMSVDHVRQVQQSGYVPIWCHVSDAGSCVSTQWT